MKKKGLIIATVVMVVVLIASITTATYAWFSASTNTTVDALTLQVNSASAVAIGARTAAVNGSGNSQDDYMYDAVTLGNSGNTPSYTGGMIGLGTSLSFSGEQGTLTLTKAVGSASSVTAATAPTSPDNKFNPDHQIYAASSGDSDSVIDNASVIVGRANQDYIVLQMGAQAAQAAVYGIYATVKITTTDTATTLKMMAAMHFYIRVYDNDATTHKDLEFDLFGSSATNNTAKTAAALGALTAPDAAITYAAGTGADAGQATATFSFLIGGADHVVKDGQTVTTTALATDGSDIFNFDIYAYIDGKDDHCVSKATGSGAKFEIEFSAVGANDTSAPATFLTLVA